MQLNNPVSILERIAAAKSVLTDAGYATMGEFLDELAEALTATWPIARVDVLEGRVSKCELYAPGLPTGSFEMYLAPEGVPDAELSVEQIAEIAKLENPIQHAYQRGRADAAPAANDHFSDLHRQRFEAASDNLVGVLLWALWHHQGFNSDVGLPIRSVLKMARDQRLSPEQVRQAKDTIVSLGFSSASAARQD